MLLECIAERLKKFPRVRIRELITPTSSIDSSFLSREPLKLSSHNFSLFSPCGKCRAGRTWEDRRDNGQLILCTSDWLNLDFWILATNAVLSVVAWIEWELRSDCVPRILYFALFPLTALFWLSCVLCVRWWNLRESACELRDIQSVGENLRNVYELTNVCLGAEF